MIKNNSMTSQRSGYVLEVSAIYTRFTFFSVFRFFFVVFLCLTASRVVTSRASLTLHEKFTYFLTACGETENAQLSSSLILIAILRGKIKNSLPAIFCI